MKIISYFHFVLEVALLRLPMVIVEGLLIVEGEGDLYLAMFIEEPMVILVFMFF